MDKGRGGDGASVRAARLASGGRFGISRGGLGGSGREISPNAGSPCAIHFGVLEIAPVRNSAAAAAAAAQRPDRPLPQHHRPAHVSPKHLYNPLKVRLFGR